MPSPKPSIRLIARKSGYSVATVSQALRGSEKVRPATRARICEVAELLGYARNTLVGDVMSRMRLSQTRGYSGNIAVLDTAAFREQRKTPRWHQDVFKGAEARAAEFGFKLEFILIDPYMRSLGRLQQVLYHRGIRGLFLPPFLRRTEFKGFDWSLFSVVQMDYCLRKVRMHSVLPDHHLSMVNSLRRLERMGYRRPGLMVERDQDERIFMKWLAGFRAFECLSSHCESFPVFGARDFDRDGFLAWFREARPDVLLGHRGDVIDWLREEGYGVPEEVGFFSLNLHHTDLPVAGLDLRPDMLGAGAIDILVAQIHMPQRGAPKIPSTTMLEGVWVDGPSLRYDLPGKE